MNFKAVRSVSFLLLILFITILCQPVAAQAPAGSSISRTDSRSIRPSIRVNRAIDDQVTVTLAGNHHPLARRDFDEGPAAANTRMDRMMLVLSPDAAQQAALEALLAAQQDPASPEFHRWLTPEAFGQRFGISEQDYRQIEHWLKGHGFSVEPAAATRREILFSGTAAQVQRAFHTEMRVYNANGETHFANASDPQIPAALAEVVGGVVSLHNFQSKPMHHLSGPADFSAPNFTSGTSHYLAPADFAAIYDVAGLYSQSINGNGQSIAIVGRTNFAMQDVTAFRSRFGLPVNNPTVVLNGADPGIVSQGELGEALLDVEWSGAVAPNALIQFVLSASTNSSDGVALSAQYAVSHNIAPVVSVSFGSCEASNGTSGNQFWNSLWQQAAAQGITALVSSGDSGAAGCDSPSASTATHAAGVNAICSTPYSVCVGGTQFSDASSPSTYWSASNAASTGASALSYIPEAVWNTSGSAGGSGLWSSAGGASKIYPKPSWQTGVGVPSGNFRYVPDVSLNSSTHDGYLVTMNGQLFVFGGTSAASPSFAGLLALVVQRSGARIGNANPALYSLSAAQGAGGAAVFHGVTSGNNSVPGATGFTAGAGFDEATGLGSVDASQLVNHWSNSATPLPALQLAVSPNAVSVAQGGSGTVTAGVSVSGGFNSASLLTVSGLPSGLTATFTPASFVAPGAGTASLRLTASSGLAAGTYILTVTAAGGGLSQTTSLGVTVNSTCAYTVTPTETSAPASGGNLSVNVTTSNGCSWTATTLTSWISLTAPASGTGPSLLKYSVAANNTTAIRNGSITVAGKTVSVAQAAGTSSFSLSSTSASFPMGGGTSSVTVSASPPTATWMASSNVNWISIAGSASNTGSKTLTYTVAPNTSANRTGTMTIAGATFTVTQAGPSITCTYQIAVGQTSQTSQGFTGSVSVITGAGCAWTASSDSSWLTVTSGSSGTGSGKATFLAAFNTTNNSRSGTLTIAGSKLTLTESPSSSRPNVQIGTLGK